MARVTFPPTRRNSRKRFYILDAGASAHWKSLSFDFSKMLQHNVKSLVEQAPQKTPVLDIEALVHAADEHK